jgi:uridine nucleosidase
MSGQTGLDGTTHLPQPIAQAIEKPNAVLAMRHALLAETQGTSWLVATGTLTNVALLFAAFPDLVGHIKGLSIMGGAIGGGFTDAPLGTVKGEGERFGNTTAWAEFNIYCDPEAAQAIFSNAELAAKTTLIPLDLTHQMLATQEVQNRVLRAATLTNIGHLFHDILVFFAGTYREVFGLSDGPPLHDPVAVAVLLDDQTNSNSLFDDQGGERWHVKVETDGLHGALRSERVQVGRTIASKMSDGENGVRIPRKTDTERFWKMIEECLHLAQDAVLA